MPRDFISQDQLAEQLGVTVRTIRNWISKGYLPGYRVGPRKIMVREADAQKMFQTIPATRARTPVASYGPKAKILDMRSVVLDEDEQ